jgi:arsenate reductase
MEWKGYGRLRGTVEEQLKLFDLITEERMARLVHLAGDIAGRYSSEEQLGIIFICTHNSRRSQMSQLWAQLAVAYFHLEGIICYSGGTMVTNFHPMAVSAMEQAGFRIWVQIPGSNPVYRADFPGARGDIRLFSKKYTDPPNPARGFISVMNCSEADEACPVVHGAVSRHALPYEDPKVHDGTGREREGYSGTSLRIAGEMLFLFSRVAVTQ